MTTTTKAAPKKRPARKTEPKASTSKAGARTSQTTKTPAKRTTKSTATKKEAAASPKKPGLNVRGEKSEHGYVIGSALNDVAEAVVAGGTTRQDVLEKLRASANNLTASGKERNWSVAMSTVLRQMYEAGYTVEATWRVVPPKGGAKPVSRAKTASAGTKKAAAAKPAAKKAAPAKKKAPARKKTAAAEA